MSGMVIVGAQWGDEGKGKFVDVLTRQAQWVVRYQGGNNAGHTIVIDGEKTALSLLPSGILRPGVRCLLGAGVVLNPSILIQEIEQIRSVGGDVSPGRIVLDRDAHLVLDYHIAIDKAREEKRGAGKIGTTGKGIGPAYEDRSQRSGIRAADLCEIGACKDLVRRHVEEKNKILRHVLESNSQIEFESLWETLRTQAEVLAPYVGNGSSLITTAIENGDNVIFEGAQGVLLDQTHGTYPYVTSSSTGAGGVLSGVGIGPRCIGEVIGVVKAYTTRVGEGPFPTELSDSVGQSLREKGHEFGTVTGRPRRCGWLDLVALRRAVRVSGIDALVLTKLDVLSGLETIRLCVGYENKSGVIDDLPARAQDFEGLEPVYVDMPGWPDDLTSVQDYSDLPATVQGFVEKIEELSGCKVVLASVGPGREQTIRVRKSEILERFL
jgi:adenylosuccinate synthase